MIWYAMLSSLFSFLVVAALVPPVQPASALAEAVGLLGLLAYLLSGSWPIFAGFASVSFVLLLLLVPRPTGV